VDWLSAASYGLELATAFTIEVTLLRKVLKRWWARALACTINGGRVCEAGHIGSVAVLVTAFGRRLSQCQPSLDRAARAIPCPPGGAELAG
jgi:hypothetical protein